MKVFISWSGDRSKHLADALYGWLPVVVQSVDPWMSSSDIQKGSIPLDEIAKQLDQCDYGLICLTPENQHAPWIQFEAGAISKKHWASQVYTCLFGMSYTDVTGPLSRFQHTLTTRADEVERLVHSINAASERPIDAPRLAIALQSLLPRFEAKLASIPAPPANETPPERNQQDMMAEVLQLVRDLSNSRHVSPKESSRPRVALPQRVFLEVTGERSNIAEFADYITALTDVAVDWSDPVDGKSKMSFTLTDRLSARQAIHGAEKHGVHVLSNETRTRLLRNPLPNNPRSR